jgi:hypothetical protein
MSEELDEQTSIVPVEQHTISFYGDELVAARDAAGTVWVPLKPIVESLGLTWSSQFMRVKRDPILSEEARGILIMRTPQKGGEQSMVALPLKFVRAWLFGVSSERAKPEIRERLLQYKREIIEVIDHHFSQVPTQAPSSALVQIRELGLAIVRMAEQQMELEAKQNATESRLNRAAEVVSGISRRLTAVERKLTPGTLITEEQAAQISVAVKALADILTKPGAGSAYQAVFAELYRRFGVTSYHNIKLDDYNDVLLFLEDWRQRTVQRSLEAPREGSTQEQQ